MSTETETFFFVFGLSLLEQTLERKSLALFETIHLMGT